VSVETKRLVPGLAGVPAAESSVSYIDGQAGILEYRGIRIEVLAEHSNFEEVAWLLMYGKLPTSSELQSLRKRLRGARELPKGMIDLLRAMPKNGHPMDALQAGVAALGMWEPRFTFGNDKDFEHAWIRLLAATPCIVAAFDRLRAGKEPLAPDPTLDTAGNFLWQLTGSKPDPIAAQVLDCALVLHADHEMNASTFAARVVFGTEADPYTSCSAGVGALHGPLHGGANERVLESLESIGSIDNVESWAQARFAEGGKIMGFGHRVYKVKDPRSHALQALGARMFAKLGSTPIYDVALKLEKLVTERLGGKGIYPNVDFFSGILYSKLGIAKDQFTPVFAIARTAGWLAHLYEQMQDNKLYRPGQIYTGGHELPYTPIEKRG
jgi:citrate synthase